MNPFNSRAINDAFQAATNRHTINEPGDGYSSASSVRGASMQGMVQHQALRIFKPSAAQVATGNYLDGFHDHLGNIYCSLFNPDTQTFDASQPASSDTTGTQCRLCPKNQLENTELTDGMVVLGAPFGFGSGNNALPGVAFDKNFPLYYPISAIPGQGASCRWCVVYRGFYNGDHLGTTAGSCHYFEGYISDCDGHYNPTEGTIKVYLEKNTYRYPNLEDGNVVEIYYNDREKEWMCSTQDDFVGAIKIIDCNIDIPQGWTLCDGTEDTPDTIGRFVWGTTDEGNTGTSNDCGDMGGEECFTIYPDSTFPQYTTASKTVQVLAGTPGAGQSHVYVADRDAHYVIPPSVVCNLPPYVKLRYIIRWDNSLNP